MSNQVEFKKGKSFFTIVGEAKINDYTYKLDAVSESGWQYNMLNLGIDCGNGNVVYADMMGGFSTVKDTTIYVNSKEDFTNVYAIDFEDRFEESILETIHPFSFIKIGIEKDTNDKIFVKQFLSEYDAIHYLHEHLEDGMVVNVRGDLRYSIYNDNIQIRKEIKSIFLSKAELKDYRATFVQSILIDKDSVGKFDKELNSYPIDARVVDYIKEYNGHTIKRNIPLYQQFELEKNDEKPEVTQALLSKFFHVKEGVNEIAVEGKIIEGQQLVEVSEDDIPEDIKELIELGIYEKEEILNKMAVTGDRVRRYIITKPYVQMVGETEEERRPRLFIEKNKYKEEDLILDFMFEDSEEDDVDTTEDIIDDAIEDDDDLSWLANLE